MALIALQIETIFSFMFFSAEFRALEIDWVIK